MNWRFAATERLYEPALLQTDPFTNMLMQTKLSLSRLQADNLIGQRLKTEMKRRGFTSSALARAADVKTSFIYDIISGKSSNPSTVKLARVAQALGINISNLVDKDALIEDTDFSVPVANDYITIPRILVDISNNGTSLIVAEQDKENYTFRKSWIHEHLNLQPDHLRMVYIYGDSMTPTLCHNDIILVDTSRRVPSPPGLFVLFDGIGLVAKRLEYATDDASPLIRIVSDNLHYSSSERAMEELHIVGRVVWLAREI